MANLPTISNALLRFVGAHACLCKACAPEYHEDLEDEMMLEAAEIHKASLSREVKQAVKQKFLDEYRAQIITEASQEVIQAEKANMREEVLAECKEMLKKEIRQEWETLEMGRIKAEMKKEMEDKLKQAMAMMN